MVLRPSKSASVLAPHTPSETSKQATRFRFISTTLVLVGTACIVYIITTSQAQASQLRHTEGPGESAVEDVMISDENVAVTLWSSDFHISPIADIKHLLLQSPNVTVIDKSLSGHCHLTKTCANGLRVINRENGIALAPCPNQIRRDFYGSYKADPVMLNVDGFICTHAASMCELFMPFQKPLIVIASTR
jgi:hypothetical protein